jgi:virulence-associated protein VagC
MKLSRPKLFRKNGSQAVSLPKGCRFRSDAEVTVRKEGRRVIIEAKDEWSATFRACLGAWSGAIPRPKQRRLVNEQNPFA